MQALAGKTNRRVQGIAVGIATKIPPHNLVEVVAAMRALVQEPGLSDEQLHEFVLGPDFPTGGVLLATPGVKAAYTEGRGSVTIRSRVQIEAGQGRSDRDVIAVTELPYQVYKAALIKEIADLVDKGSLEGIADIQDESDRRGMRIAIEVKRGSDAQVVLNNLLQHSRLQMRYGANMVALVDHKPRQLTLKAMLQAFIDFRLEARAPLATRCCELRADILHARSAL